ncbi:MAG: hypothetical protein WBW99_20280, partial [Pseudolabrys sp.]
MLFPAKVLAFDRRARRSAQENTVAAFCVMFALPQKADIHQRERHVRPLNCHVLLRLRMDMDMEHWRFNSACPLRRSAQP